VKEFNDFSIGKATYMGRLLPAVEQAFTDWFSARVGLEGTLHYADSVSLGYGAILGLSFKIKSIGLQFDINFSYKSGQSGMAKYPDIRYNDLIILFSVSWDGIFISK
jgi:hypothetical protein